jgi:hypothetical protein
MELHPIEVFCLSYCWLPVLKCNYSNTDKLRKRTPKVTTDTQASSRTFIPLQRSFLEHEFATIFSSKKESVIIRTEIVAYSHPPFPDYRSYQIWLSWTPLDHNFERIWIEACLAHERTYRARIALCLQRQHAI